jgi:hypothetical protein
VLGLGAIGPLGAKPVMEGKAVLFKKFAGIDVFDIEIAEHDPDRLVDIIAALEPRARFSPLYRETNKGDIAYMQPPPEAIARLHEGAGPGLVVAPVYRLGSPVQLQPIERAAGLRWLIDNAVNYSSMLETGFELLAGFVERCELYSLTYSKLEEAIALIERLHTDLPPRSRSRH